MDTRDHVSNVAVVEHLPRMLYAHGTESAISVPHILGCEKNMNPNLTGIGIFDFGVRHASTELTTVIYHSWLNGE